MIISMSILRYTSLICGLLLLGMARHASAFERPAAQIINDGWQLCLSEPLTDVVRDRRARPDWPYLSPELHDLVSPGDNRQAPDKGWLPAKTGVAWEEYGGADYNEAGWYLKVIDIPEDYRDVPDTRLWLEFDAVSTAAAVWCNGHYLGGHVGDYARWRVELTEFLTEDPSCEVLVYVDELPFHTTQGFLSMIAPHHGGIWQDVRLYTTGPASIVTDSLHIETDNTVVTIYVSFDLDTRIPMDELVPQVWMNSIKSGTNIFDNELAILDLEIEEGTATFRLQSGSTPLRWSPENPQLYSLYIELHTRIEQSAIQPRQDAIRQTMAFRDIEMDGNLVLLNGQPIRIRSALQWGYYPGLFGPVPTPEQVREEFAYIKSLGFNAETVCLVNMPDYFYDIADEMGILIWQEYPSWHALFSAGEERTLTRQFGDFVRRDRHHPSIIMRSLSVEAGVEDWDVMARLHGMVKSMTREPVQDNNSWFSHSRPEYTDWYGEDNYFNNFQWKKHLQERLPVQLRDYPAKPYIIGESLLCNTWVDADALDPVSGLWLSHDIHTDRDNSPGNYLGNDDGTAWPWWFPSCFDSVLDTNLRLREFYRDRLPADQDIVNDYLLPQSTRAAMNMRRFQIETLDAQSYVGGYTLNVVRDMPLIRAGLLDDLGRPRWAAEDWDWHGWVPNPSLGVPDQPGTRVQSDRPEYVYVPEPEDLQGMLKGPFLVMQEGYLDLQDMLGGIADARFMDEEAIVSAADPATAPVVVTSVLTHRLVDYISGGGRVILLCSKMPGALNAQPHFFWRDALFVPPVGPFANVFDNTATANQIVDWQGYELNRSKGDVIPVDTLGIRDDVDPLIRLFDTHDLSEVVTNDQIWGTRIGEGTLIASALDHSSPTAQWLLLYLMNFLDLKSQNLSFEDEPLLALTIADPNWPLTSLSQAAAHALAVSRANGIMDLTPGWQFSLDEAQQGETLGWQAAGFDDSAWAAIDAGKGWESAGYSYNGQAWYRKAIEIPADWEGSKVRLVAEGIDDAYTVWINGVEIATHGSFTEHELTVWLQQTVTDITDALNYGEENTLALQVMDITGQGGIWRPIYLAVE
jgi:hypothetical protein